MAGESEGTEETTRGQTWYRQYKVGAVIVVTVPGPFQNRYIPAVVVSQEAFETNCPDHGSISPSQVLARSFLSNEYIVADWRTHRPFDAWYDEFGGDLALSNLDDEERYAFRLAEAYVYPEILPPGWEQADIHGNEREQEPLEKDGNDGENLQDERDDVVEVEEDSEVIIEPRVDPPNGEEEETVETEQDSGQTEMGDGSPLQASREGTESPPFDEDERFTWWGQNYTAEQWAEHDRDAFDRTCFEDSNFWGGWASDKYEQWVARRRRKKEAEELARWTFADMLRELNRLKEEQAKRRSLQKKDEKDFDGAYVIRTRRCLEDDDTRRRNLKELHSKKMEEREALQARLLDVSRRLQQLEEDLHRGNPAERRRHCRELQEARRLAEKLDDERRDVEEEWSRREARESPIPEGLRPHRRLRLELEEYERRQRLDEFFRRSDEQRIQERRDEEEAERRRIEERRQREMDEELRRQRRQAEFERELVALEESRRRSEEDESRRKKAKRTSLPSTPLSTSTSSPPTPQTNDSQAALGTPSVSPEIEVVFQRNWIRPTMIPHSPVVRRGEREERERHRHRRKRDDRHRRDDSEERQRRQRRRDRDERRRRWDLEERELRRRQDEEDRSRRDERPVEFARSIAELEEGLRYREDERRRRERQDEQSGLIPEWAATRSSHSTSSFSLSPQSIGPPAALGMNISPVDFQRNRYHSTMIPTAPSLSRSAFDHSPDTWISPLSFQPPQHLPTAFGQSSHGFAHSQRPMQTGNSGRSSHSDNRVPSRATNRPEKAHPSQRPYNESR